MSETRECTHQGQGGVSTNFDPYKIRGTLGLAVHDWRHVCWPCWKEWGLALSKGITAETERALQARGCCGFLEAYRGYCLQYRPCADHRSQRCWQCKAPATRNCSHAGSFVCGAPECAEHSHGEYHAQKYKEYQARKENS